MSAIVRENEIMLSNLPIARSAGARAFFFASVVVTLAIIFWIPHLRPSGLTAIFFVLFARMDRLAALGMAVVLLIAAFISARSIAVLPRWVGRHPVAIAVATAIVLCAGSLLVYENHPLSMDEYAQFFQSEIFAHGRLTGLFPVPLLDWLIPPFFQNQFLVVSPETGAVVSAYWPSFALLLTPFTWLGIPWACNPVISALTILVIHRLALRLFQTEESAGLAVLLTVASTAFLADGISYYSMPAHLLANAVFALLLLEPSPRRALLAGVVGSIAVTLHNPVPHILFAIPWLFWTVRRPRGFQTLGWLIIGYAPLCALLGVGWFWFSSGLSHAAGVPMGAQADAMRQIANIFSLPSSSLLLARTIGLAKIWLWAVPGLIILAAAGAWKWRDSGACRALVASAILTFIGYYFVPVDQGHGWGFRYFHSAWFVLPLLAAGAFSRQADYEQRLGVFDDVETRTFVVACALLSLVFGAGLRAVQIRGFMTNDQLQVPAYAGTEHRVVLIDAAHSFYGQDLVQNDPWLRGNAIRMISHGETADATMMRNQFPDMHCVYQDSHGAVWSSASASGVSDCTHKGT
jgi:hypothetical protein